MSRGRFFFAPNYFLIFSRSRSTAFLVKRRESHKMAKTKETQKNFLSCVVLCPFLAHSRVRSTQTEKEDNIPRNNNSSYSLSFSLGCDCGSERACFSSLYLWLREKIGKSCSTFLTAVKSKSHITLISLL